MYGIYQSWRRTTERRYSQSAHAEKRVLLCAGLSETAVVEKITPNALVIGVFPKLSGLKKRATSMSDQNHNERCRQHQRQKL